MLEVLFLYSYSFERGNIVKIDQQFRCIVTVYRKEATGKWSVQSISYANNNKLSRLFRFIHYRKMKEFCIETGYKLGKNFSKCKCIVLDVYWHALKKEWVVLDSERQYRNSKWTQHLIYMQNHSLRPFLPQTALYTKWTHDYFLTQYHEVYIKPAVGQQGKGIVYVSTTNRLTYEIQQGKKKFTSLTKDETYEYLVEHILSKKSYIIQQKIELASIDGCPMDVRVITQKDQSKWVVTGVIVKVAAKDYFVTNVAQKLLSLEEAIAQSTLLLKESAQLHAEIEAVCFLTANQLEQENNEIDLIGFDIGIDKDGVIWIIEANYVPNLAMFHKFQDGDMYEQIYKYLRR